MAEKKVSTRNRKNSNPPRDNSYDDFIAEYGAKLRRRATRVVPQPEKRKSNEPAEESRCGEIDPHMTVNPATEHQISTRRGGRIFSDDSGFRAESYNQRFELTPELPEITDAAAVEVIEESSIPGQQTMADLMEEHGITDAAAPVEGQIEDSDEDPFSAAYKYFRSQSPAGFGKSEKLRAIARTATDDTGSEAENQLTFPAFDPLFSFPDEEQTEKKADKKSKRRLKKSAEKKTDENQSFDIEEAEIVTSHTQPEEEAPAQEEEKPASHSKFVDFLTDKEFQQEVEPAFEISSKSELSATLRQLTKHGRAALIKTAALFFAGLVLFIILAVSGKDNVVFNALTSLVFLAVSGVLCFKELSEGIRDIIRKRLTQGVVAVIFVIPALLQIISALITKSNAVQLLTPAVILSLTAITAPQLLLTNNAKLTAGMFLSGDVSLLRKASDGGIEGVVKEKFAGSTAELRYSTKTAFATGLMKKLTNAVPKPVWANAVYMIIAALALISAVAAGFICNDSFTGVSALCAILVTCIPSAYTFVAALFLYNTNNDIAPGRSSLISYKCASELTETKAVVFNASDIIEHSACSIHGVKAFGGTDPHLASLCCASVINATGSPLSAIMKQITDQTEIDVPEAESFEVISGGGVRATVNGNNVLLGTRDFLEDNGIYIPKENYDEMFLTGDRKLLYLALNGRFALILIVSYHIKRSVAAFFKNLAARNIKIVIYSADPNLTPGYISKKCRLPENSVSDTGSAEAAYFMDKENRTQSALAADVFTDGSVNSVANLFRKAFKISRAIYILPFVSYIMSALCVFLIICPLFLGSAAIIGNLYVIILKAAAFAASVISLLLMSKQK